MQIIEALTQSDTSIGIIQIPTTMLFLSILWPLCRRFWAKGAKYCFAGFFLSLGILVPITQYLGLKSHEGDFVMTISYILMMSFFTYCELGLSMFFYTPIYIVSALLTQLANQSQYDKIKE